MNKKVMNKKVLVAASVILFCLLIGGAFWIFKSRKTTSVVSPPGELTSEPEVKLATWEDQAGFSFSYPEGLEINPHEEDMDNYAHLELTSPNSQGNIVIWVKDTNHLDIETWAKEEVSGGQIFETELGGEPAKKVAYLNPERLVTAAIDVDALVLIEMTPDEEGYWQEIYDQILANFTFIPLEGEESAAPGAWEGSGGAGGIIEEAEEVIE